MNTTMEPTTKRFKSYTLDPLVSGTLTLDMRSGALTLLQSCEVAELQVFTPLEIMVIHPLLNAYPHYCPHAQMLATATMKSMQECEEEVSWAYENRGVDAVMRPLRNILSRCRKKARPFGIDIRSVSYSGYILVSSKAGAQHG